MTLPGAVPSPNIWQHPDVYEVENRTIDPDGVVEQAMAAVHDWSGKVLLDLGCGTGFHLPRWAERAARVVGVEPHAPLREAAAARVAALGPDVAARVRVLAGTAQAVPLPDASVDVVQARWSYFFGPGCEPGLAELARVVRRGGTAFVVDHDASRSTFGRWFRRAHPRYDPVGVQRFWARQGWQHQSLDVRWQAPSRAAFEAVVRIELPPDVADAVLAEHDGTALDHALLLRWRRF